LRLKGNQSGILKWTEQELSGVFSTQINLHGRGGTASW
jgi:hypothetical protein